MRVFFFQAEDGIRDLIVTGVQTCALPIFGERIGVADGRPVYGQAPSREFTRALRASLALDIALGLLAAFHAVSTWMSTSARGSRSTCATSVMARPLLVKPVSRTSSPYSG